MLLYGEERKQEILWLTSNAVILLLQSVLTLRAAPGSAQTTITA